MPQMIPESPRRSTAAATNPLKSDPTLIKLMDELDVVDSYEGFQNWKNNFLGRFELFLGGTGSSMAQTAYDDFRSNRMGPVVKKVEKVKEFVEKGDLSTDRVSVKARNAMNELSVYLLDTVKDVRGLAPPTSADEAKVGFTKYNLGAVLVRDGFQEYERLQLCKDILDKLREDCIEAIGDEKMLEAIKKYDEEIDRFVALMEDLGLYKIMLKNREFDPNERNRERKKKENGDDDGENSNGNYKNDNDKPAAYPVLPSIPFDDDDGGGDDGNGGTTPTASGTLPETDPNDNIVSPSKKNKDNPDKYTVSGSWGSLMDIGDGSGSGSGDKPKIKQDLAVPTRDPSPGRAAKNRNPEKVFVTPIRPTRGRVSGVGGTIATAAATAAVEPSSKSMGNLPSLDDSERSNSVGAAAAVGGKPPKPMVGGNDPNRILDTDTPRTRKAKLDWMSVQTVPKIPDSGKAKGSSSSGKQKRSSSLTKKRSPPKPPRPEAKELVTKTQDKGWTMQLDPSANPDDAWCRAREPTKNEGGGNSRSNSPKKVSSSSSRPSSPENAGAVAGALSSSAPPEKNQRDDDESHALHSVSSDVSTITTTANNETAETVKTMVTTTTTTTTTNTINEEQNSQVVQNVQNSAATTTATSGGGTVYVEGQGGTVYVEGPTTTTTKYVEVSAAPVVVMKSLPREVVTSTTERNDTVTVIESTKVHLVESRLTGVEWIGSMTAMAPVAGRDVGNRGRVIVTGSNIRKASSIRYLTFCSIDDSIDPRLLGIIGRCYPLVEFAVLLRPDMAGQPRYASPGWLQKLAYIQGKQASGMMRLAAHLCGSLVNEVLRGEDGILKKLMDMKFQRVQLNATAINGVNTYEMGKYAANIITVAEKYPELEITIQRNEETRPLWEGVLNAAGGGGESSTALPSNISMLFDESKGMGIMPDVWQPAPRNFPVGYAGGVGLGGRTMTKQMLHDILRVGNGQSVWVSMESSMRCTKNGKDVFDINKCYDIIDAATECNIHLHPGFIS